MSAGEAVLGNGAASMTACSAVVYFSPVAFIRSRAFNAERQVGLRPRRREVDLHAPRLQSHTATLLNKPIVGDQDLRNLVIDRRRIGRRRQGLEAEEDVDILPRVATGLACIRPDQDRVDPPTGVRLQQLSDFSVSRNRAAASRR